MSKKWMLISLLPIQVLLVSWIGAHPDMVETFYAQGIYPYVSLALRTVTFWVPFSVGQLLFYSFLVYSIYWAWKGIRKVSKGEAKIYQQLWSALKNALAVFSIVYFFFMLSWGLNYRRQSIAEIAELDTSNPSDKELIEMCALLIKECNEIRQSIEAQENLPVADNEMLDLAIEGFDNNSEYPFLSYPNPSVKKVLFPRLMSLFSIGGIYFMFTGEANINMDPPNFLTPATICHEMAHQLGFASEDEANYIGYLATQLNSDKNFNYSGDLMALRYSMRSLYGTDSVAYDSLASMLDEAVLSDLRITREYWQSFYNPLDPISDKIYDLFLKANRQKAGIRSYSLVVRLLIAEYRRSKLVF